MNSKASFHLIITVMAFELSGSPRSLAQTSTADIPVPPSVAEAQARADDAAREAREAAVKATEAKARADTAAAALEAAKNAPNFKSTNAKAIDTKDDTKQAAQDISAAEQQLRGLGFGVGVGALFDVGGRARVKNASVDPKGIVRVEEENSVRVGAILETHYLWKFDSRAPDPASRRVLYHGPQVSAILGENVFDGIGIGYMVALRRRNVESSNFALKSFNLGAGVMVQPDVQTLGDGLEEGKSLPAGDQLRYESGPKAGVYLMFSAGF